MHATDKTATGTGPTEAVREEAGRVEVHRDEAARDEPELNGPREDAAAESIVDSEDDHSEPGRATASAEVPDGRTETAVTELVPAAEADGIRERWRDVQLRFVDDPRSAVEQAAALVDDVTQSLMTAIESRRSELGAWRNDSGAGAGQDADTGPGQTEQLRVVVQRYREFIDRVLGV